MPAETVPTSSSSAAAHGEHRYTVAARDRELGLLWRAGSGAWEPIKLFEISSQRMLLETTDPLPAQSAVAIRLELNDDRRSFECEAVVEWSQMSVRQSWWVSCELAEPVCHRLIDRLAHEGLVERRQDPRFPIDFQAQIKFELTDEWCAARLTDYSAGGFQAELRAMPATSGQRILLRVQDADETVTDLAARLVWIRRGERHMTAGFAFVHRTSYLKLRRAAGLTNPKAKVAALESKGGRWLGPLRMLLNLLGLRQAKAGR